jgi:putative mRNA 3-end processing factor
VPGAQGHQKIVSTAQTAELLRALAAVHGRGRRAHEPQALVTPYRRPFTLGQLSLELIPSGHALGSASLFLRHRGMTILYAGDISVRASRMAERVEVRPCDMLVLPCRFGERRFVLPRQEDVAGSLLRFVADARERGETAVLFCPPLGEAQELASLLLSAGLVVHAHRQIVKVCRIHHRAGMPLAGLRRYRGAVRQVHVLLWPAELRWSPTLRRLASMRTALVSGWALDEEAVARMGCDAAFPFSCHADYAALLEYVRACSPGHVVLVSGPGKDLQEDLEGLGLRVSRAGTPRQMDLF